MLASLTPALFPILSRTFASPYLFPNSTVGTNTTICNGTAASHLNASQCNNTLSTTSAVQHKCETVYPADLTVVNARYPDYNTSHLHDTKRFFMLRRQFDTDGEIATRVQFQGLPPSTTNKTCRLEIVLPRPELQTVQGSNPSFNVYQVERGADSVATWKTYEGYKSAKFFGMVNGEPEALERTRQAGGVAAINDVLCNETLTFQMGMAYNSVETPNYWEFSNVVPPATPVQGFRVVFGC
jgi:hypothetical protein